MTQNIPSIGASTPPKKATRYTVEETEELVMLYVEDPTPENVEYLSQKFVRSKRSIIGKLAKEGVYISTAYKPKYGDKPVTKDQITADIEKLLGIVEGGLEGLSKAHKQVLLDLQNSIKELVETNK